LKHKSNPFINGCGPSEPFGKQKWAQAAAEQIQANCPQTRNLIQYLTQVNAHNIPSATTMKFDMD
jgi:hypothetical protein